MAPPDEGAAAGGVRRWVRRETLLGLALGQFVSLLITATGFASSELARRGTCVYLSSTSTLHYTRRVAFPACTPAGRRQPSRARWIASPPPPPADRRDGECSVLLPVGNY
jgi:solute carrier family 35 protein F1/2